MTALHHGGAPVNRGGDSVAYRDSVIEAKSLMEAEEILKELEKNSGLKSKQGTVYALIPDAAERPLEHAPLIRLRRAVAISLDAKLPAGVDDGGVPAVDRNAVDREQFGKGHLWQIKRTNGSSYHTLTDFVDSRLYRV